MQGSKLVAAMVVFISIVLYAFHYTSVQPPNVVANTASTDTFSGARAHSVLSTLLKENRAHPVGSEQNKVVKLRIMDELRALNIEFTEQRTWACANRRFNICAFVENIVAVIPGETDSPYVAIMAHYDSTPMAIGAGDDGAGVAAILETGRILKAEAPFKNPIILLFTDAEEIGLVGAEAFFQQHPLASQTGFVMNFEGSGTSGASMILRTSAANQFTLESLISKTPKPIGNSITTEIFKRMPNDTDFSVVLRAGIPGVDFAFAGERNHYHTFNDNVENIDQRVIQHHGDNMLGLTRAMANANLDELGGSVVFVPAYGLLVNWMSDYSPYLLVLSFVLLSIGAVRMEASVKGVLLGLIASVGVLLISCVIAFATFKLIAFIQGTVVSWPASHSAHRVALLFSAVSGGLIAIAIANRYLRQVDSLVGVWLLWLILSTALIIYLPDAAIQLLAPVMLSSLLVAVASFLPVQYRSGFLLLSLLLVIPNTLGTVLLIEQSQGYHLIVAAFPFLALYMSAIGPLIHGVKLKLPLIASVFITLAAVTATASSPLYSDWRPQIIYVNFYQDVDQKSAYFQLQSDNPIPEKLMSLMPFDKTPKQLIPYNATKLRNWVQAKPSGLAEPKINVIADKLSSNGRVLDVEIKSPRQAARVGLLLPESTQLNAFSIDGQQFTPSLVSTGPYEGKYLLFFGGVYNRTISLQLNLGSSEPFEAYLYDISTTLPEEGLKLVEKRHPLGAAAHSGDQAILFTKHML